MYVSTYVGVSDCLLNPFGSETCFAYICRYTYAFEERPTRRPAYSCCQFVLTELCQVGEHTWPRDMFNIKEDWQDKKALLAKVCAYTVSCPGRAVSSVYRRLKREGGENCLDCALPLLARHSLHIIYSIYLCIGESRENLTHGRRLFYCFEMAPTPRCVLPPPECIPQPEAQVHPASQPPVSLPFISSAATDAPCTRCSSIATARADTDVLITKRCSSMGAIRPSGLRHRHFWPFSPHVE